MPKLEIILRIEEDCSLTIVPPEIREMPLTREGIRQAAVAIAAKDAIVSLINPIKELVALNVKKTKDDKGITTLS